MDRGHLACVKLDRLRQAIPFEVLLRAVIREYYKDGKLKRK